jgi:phosphoribosyl-ATP pyrophosphohydrolase
VPETLHELEQTLLSRQEVRPAGSYSAGLFADPERMQRKIMEEAFEVCLELNRGAVDPGRVAAEAADLLYHLLVGLVSAGVPLDDVLTELERRR